jgi:predicted secreted protein
MNLFHLPGWLGGHPVALDDLVIGVIVLAVAGFIIAACFVDIRRIWRERGEKRIDQTAADRRARYRIRDAGRHGYPSDGDQ